MFGFIPRGREDREAISCNVGREGPSRGTDGMSLDTGAEYDFKLVMAANEQDETGRLQACRDAQVSAVVNDDVGWPLLGDGGTREERIVERRARAGCGEKPALDSRTSEEPRNAKPNVAASRQASLNVQPGHGGGIGRDERDAVHIYCDVN